MLSAHDPYFDKALEGFRRLGLHAPEKANEKQASCCNNFAICTLLEPGVIVSYPSTAALGEANAKLVKHP